MNGVFNSYIASRLRAVDTLLVGWVSFEIFRGFGRRYLMTHLKIGVMIVQQMLYSLRLSAFALNLLYSL